jgi:hypothetical protein
MTEHALAVLHFSRRREEHISMILDFWREEHELIALCFLVSRATPLESSFEQSERQNIFFHGLSYSRRREEHQICPHDV